jgi:hypothetical protein
VVFQGLVVRASFRSRVDESSSVVIHDALEEVRAEDAAFLRAGLEVGDELIVLLELFAAGGAGDLNCAVLFIEVRSEIGV